MSGPYVQLTESETSRPILFNVDRVICVAPHGRGGSFIYVLGSSDRFEVEEPPSRISEILQAAGAMYTQEERQE
jgi:hypothetical protein